MTPTQQLIDIVAEALVKAFNGDRDAEIEEGAAAVVKALGLEQIGWRHHDPETYDYEYRGLYANKEPCPNCIPLYAVKCLEDSPVPDQALGGVKLDGGGIDLPQEPEKP